MTNAEIRAVVVETVRELRKNGLLRRQDDVAYSEISARLYNHFCKMPDEELEAALKAVENDYYYDILMEFYGKRQSIEKIAEKYECEISTVVRNKKRLCLKIYLLIS